MKVIIFACAVSIAYANAIDKSESEAHMHQDSEPTPAEATQSVRQGKQYAFAYAQPSIHPAYAQFVPSYQPQYYTSPQAYRFVAPYPYPQAVPVQHPQYLQSSRNFEAVSILADTPQLPSIERMPQVNENNPADSQGRFLWNFGSSTVVSGTTTTASSGGSASLCKYNYFGGNYLCLGR